MAAPRFSISEISMAVTVNGKCLGWAAKGPSGFLYRYKFRRRSVGSDDVSISILYCGVCITDVVWTRNQLRNSNDPIVPGHEIVGIVTEVGSNAGRFKVGDRVGVGGYVNSCRECEYCGDKLEVHCLKGAIGTFGSLDVDGSITKGGYSSYIVVHERYCFKIPENYPLLFAAPLLGPGITIYSPMMRHNMNQPGKSLGVIGLGELGQLTVKFGKAFGLKVTTFSTSSSKKREALNILGADNFVLSSDKRQMVALNSSLDFIISTTSRNISFGLYLSLLKPTGVLILMGFPNEVKFNPINLVPGSRIIAGSVEGGTEQIQETLDFCASHEIYPDIELLPIQHVNEELEKLSKKDLNHYSVIDIANSLK